MGKPALTRRVLRRAIKKGTALTAAIIVSPLALLCRVTGAFNDTAIQGYAQCLALLPGVLGIAVRRAFYRLTIDHCSAECSIGFGTLLVTPRISIGEGTYIGVYCNISHCTIGRDVLIGSYVNVIAGRRIHNFDRLDVPIRHQEGHVTPLSIGDDVWIGNAALVMADVGAHAVVAAGAVVVHAVPAYAIVGGNPARVLSTRQPPSEEVSTSKLSLRRDRGDK